MKDSTGRYCIIDNQVAEADALKAISLLSASVCYEVIRVVDGILLFLEDHLKRLDESVIKSNHSYNIDYEYLKEILLKLQVNNAITTGNVKLLISFHPDEIKVPTFLAYQIFHRYPDEKQYRIGIKTSLFAMERENPNIKYSNASLQEKFRREILNQRVYEVLLVDHDGYITEGSKSNLFLIREGFLITPPAKRVLKGITRQKVITICKRLKYDLIEDNISVNKLPLFEAAFITGTSPKVLPVASIDTLTYNSNHPMISDIRVQYDALIEAYKMNIKQFGYCFNQ